jgi:hypothetical protein
MTDAVAVVQPRSGAGWLRPALLVAVLLVAYLALILSQHAFDPLALAELSGGFVNGRPVTPVEGYDGQFAYWLAIDPSPAAAGTHFDVPAYRYQRLLYPLLARLLALGQPALVPWTLLLINVVAQVAGTWAVEAWLAVRGVSRWYALTYGLWVGLVAGVRLDLTEPLSYALTALALLALDRKRPWLAALCLALAMLTKETAVVFWAALVLSAVLAKDRRALAGWLASLIPLVMVQAWLWFSFGTIGLTSGGYLATPFEWLPYMGLWRVATVSLPALILLGAISIPIAVLPSVWGIVAAVRRVWQRDWSPVVLALGANAALIAVLPFSTFREPLALVRLASGLVLCTVLFGAQSRSQRVLRYSLFWVAALVLIVRG